MIAKEYAFRASEIWLEETFMDGRIILIHFSKIMNVYFWVLTPLSGWPILDSRKELLVYGWHCRRRGSSTTLISQQPHFKVTFRMVRERYAYGPHNPNS